MHEHFYPNQNKFNVFLPILDKLVKSCTVHYLGANEFHLLHTRNSVKDSKWKYAYWRRWHPAIELVPFEKCLVSFWMAVSETEQILFLWVRTVLLREIGFLAHATKRTDHIQMYYASFLFYLFSLNCKTVTIGFVIWK